MIKMIGAQWCQPCKTVKQYLETSGIDYEYLDIDEEDTLAQLQSFGIRSVPALAKEGDDGVLKFYVGSNIDEIKKFLGG